MSAAVYSNTNKEETKVGSAVRRLTLVNFRNYKYLRLNLAQPFVILSGENGSGKSTVTSMIAGCLKPDSDADILVLDGDELKLYEMYAKGKKMMAEGKPIVKGYFEK